MKTSYYDPAGNIDYPAIKIRAAELRCDAIDAFWSELSSRAATRLAQWLTSAAAHLGARPVAGLGHQHR